MHLTLVPVIIEAALRRRCLRGVQWSEDFQTVESVCAS